MRGSPPICAVSFFLPPTARAGVLDVVIYVSVQSVKVICAQHTRSTHLRSGSALDTG